MIRPRKMKRVELTVLKSDVNAVIEYLGQHEVMHFTESGDEASNRDDGPQVKQLREQIDRLRTCAGYLGITLPDQADSDGVMPSDAENALCAKLCAAVEAMQKRETESMQEKRRIEETLNEAKAFSKLSAPFSELDQLSYLTLRVGRVDPKEQPRLKENLGERAVIIPLGDGQRILAASSRKGRFALDSELKKVAFEPIAVPEGYRGIPAELLASLEQKHKESEKILLIIKTEKEEMREKAASDFSRLTACAYVALSIEELKNHLTATASIYMLSGWIPSDVVPAIAADLAKLTNGRVAIRSYNPEEIPEIKDGSEKVPVSLKHGAFVKGFEGVVFSYGAPLYGTIDPTPLVAIFFTILFGIMFGDLGQGFVLLLAGLLTGKYGFKKLAKFRHFSIPLIAVGIASMVMGFLAGSVFTNEELLIAPTRMISAALTGHPVNRFLTIMPLAEKGGSVRKLFYFFGFTIGIGVILNSIGLAINIANRFITKKYESALFSKTGLAGFLLFWYAIFIALRIIFGGRFHLFDTIGLALPCLCIFFGPLLWRIITRKKPVLEHGLMAFIMEGFVEILETISTYISNTVSFLRVGAFALSHAVLSYIVFRFSEELVQSAGGPAGSVSALVIMIFGNVVIIVLEGMIVAIQVLRLQYYEFFSKFFTDTGVEFSPFRFSKRVKE